MKSHALGVGWRFALMVVLALALSSLAALVVPLYAQSGDKASTVEAYAPDVKPVVLAVPELRIEASVSLDAGEASSGSVPLNVTTVLTAKRSERSAPVVLDLRSREAALMLDSFGEHRPLGSIFGSTAALRC